MIAVYLLAGCVETGFLSGETPTLGEETERDPTVWDSDHDGTADAYDCEPEDAAIHPAAIEACDGVDNDCNGEEDDGDFDADGDGYRDIRDCYVLDEDEGPWDCNDNNADIHPGAVEICNGLDDDCDGSGDDIDADGDNYTECEDCDDEDGFAFPGAPEACDGVDNDCNGDIDEIWDEDGDGYSPCQDDCDDDDPQLHPGAREACDEVDNDCDGRVDEDNDLDADGQATCSGDCDDDNAAVYTGAEEICDGFDNDCDASTDETGDVDGDGWSICDSDCNDAVSTAYPGAPEGCDDVDNDCNGYTDESESCWSCTTSGSYLVCAEETSWELAVQACEGMGWELAIIGDSAENTSIASAAVFPTWIGLSDTETEGSWMWIDGDALGYDAWGVGEPTESDSYDCVLTNTSGRRGTWSSDRCDTTYQFICE